jgi:predicted helicase
VKSGKGGAKLNYRDMHQARADERRAALLTGIHDYQLLKPVLQLGLPFKPRAIGENYLSWPLLPELFPISFPGVKTSRDDVVVDIDRDQLVQRMEDYFNPKLSHEEIRRRTPAAMTSTQRFQSEPVRDQLLKRGFLPEKIVRYCYRPFDVRWLYWEPETKLLDEKRSEYFPHVGAGNIWIEARQHQPKEDFDRGYFLRTLGDNFGSGLSNFFPLYLLTGVSSLLESAGRKPNLSRSAAEYLPTPNATPEDLFYHALAILHAPAYRKENAGALRQAWPRVALPDSHRAL